MWLPPVWEFEDVTEIQQCEARGFSVNLSGRVFVEAVKSKLAFGS